MANWARCMGIGGRRGATQSCKRHRRKTRARCTRIARCGTARGRLRVPLARQRLATPMATSEKNVGPRRAETVCNKCARHGHRWTSRCSARAGAATSQATRPERGAGATRGVARRASGLERLECGIAPRRNWRRARLTWGHGGRPGNEAFCRQCIGSKACELGPRHGHPWKSRRGAIVRAASPQGRSEARPKRAMWHGARPA